MAGIRKLTIGGAAMPTPGSVKRLFEKIWSGDTGRAASGNMLGTMVAEKFKAELGWSCLTIGQMETLARAIHGTEFTTLSLYGYDGTEKTYTGYFGELTASDYSWHENHLFVTDVAVSFVEQ